MRGICKYQFQMLSSLRLAIDPVFIGYIRDMVLPSPFSLGKDYLNVLRACLSLTLQEASSWLLPYENMKKIGFLASFCFLVYFLDCTTTTVVS